MQDEEQITFDEMPDIFGKMFADDDTSGNTTPTAPNKTYSSLFEELCDKCYPERFMEPYNAQLVSAATKIYRDVLQSKNDEELQKGLMHRAYKELGVKFDGTKLYQYLMEYLNPRLYLKPFDPDRLEVANKYYESIEANKGDYIALEGIQEDAQWFITQLDEEREAERKNKEEALMSEDQPFVKDKQWLDDVRDSLGEDNWRNYVEEEYGGYRKVQNHARTGRKHTV